MKNFIKINLIVLIIFIMIVSPSIVCFATSVEGANTVTENSINTSNPETEDNNKLDELQKEKKSLEDNIQESNSQIEIVESELSDILVYLENVTLEISQKNLEIDKLTLENEKLKIYINNVQADLDDITEDYTQKKAMLDKRLVASYQMGKTSYLDVLLNSKGLISFISNYYLLSEMIAADEKLLTECSDAQKYMQELETSLLEKQQILEDNKEKIKNNKNYLENMEKIKEKQVEELSETEAELYAKINAYQTEIENVEKEIRALNIANVGSEYIGGKMAWPVPGYTRITSPFGMRTHPITGIYKLHTGTDIGAPYGALFIAANDGIVIKAEYNSAYGNMVIIDHGGGINTLYAHGSEILVQVGDYVTQGTPVLKVGSTGYSTGPHAHFEVRVNGEYQNPLDYITSYNNTDTKEENGEKKETEEVVINN